MSIITSPTASSHIMNSESQGLDLEADRESLTQRVEPNSTNPRTRNQNAQGVHLSSIWGEPFQGTGTRTRTRTSCRDARVGGSVLVAGCSCRRLRVTFRWWKSASLNLTLQLCSCSDLRLASWSPWTLILAPPVPHACARFLQQPRFMPYHWCNAAAICIA